jgi:hypothetical protein
VPTLQFIYFQLDIVSTLQFIYFQFGIVSTMQFIYFQFGIVSTLQFIIPSPTKLRRDIVTLPSIRPSFRNILVNTLESTSFNGFWPNLVHT